MCVSVTVCLCPCVYVSPYVCTCHYVYLCVQDSTLLVTGSADKNIKFWGLDFGDCHKSIFAHDDSIMAIQVCTQLS